MISIKYFLASMAVVSVLSTLPRATQCDTSYYEKYYSARRFLPLRKSPLVQVNFTVSLQYEKLEEFEKMAVVGNIKALGSWSANGAVIMNKTEEYGKWIASVWLNANSSVSYRYFIGAQTKHSPAVQVRRWESSVQSRHFNLTVVAVNRTDDFGITIASAKRETQRGWLNSGHIVQFKAFHNSLQLNDPFSSTEERLRLKLTPVDPQWRTAIIPSARAYSEYVRLEYGNSFLRVQPAHGVLYRNKDIIIFHTTVSDLQDVSYLLEVYVEDNKTDVARVIGYQYIYSDIISKSEGKISVQLLSPTWKNTIGSLNLKYLVIHPLVNSTVNFRTSFVEYWRDDWNRLEGGHRGLGASLKKKTHNAAPILENTLASMMAAGELGADIVEFDVQLTKDLVPIIYHDFSILVCMESKTPTNKDDLTEVMINDITYEQLKYLTTYHEVGSKIVEYPSHNSIVNESYRIFPTFEDFLTKVNHTLGFDIEIKWPQLKSYASGNSIQTIDKNLYVDRILSVMLEHGCGRISFFTSFDPDICSMIRFKQNMYPVLHISSNSTIPDYTGSDIIYASINNAQAFDLAGIVPNAALISENSELVHAALKQNQKVFLWGNDLKDRHSIDWFIAQSPTGVIYDRLDLFLPSNRTSVFDLDKDFPAIIQLQCSTLSQLSEENATITNILSNVNFL